MPQCMNEKPLLPQKVLLAQRVDGTVCLRQGNEPLRETGRRPAPMRTGQQVRSRDNFLGGGGQV